jgi:hypothetical protein
MVPHFYIALFYRGLEEQIPKMNTLLAPAVLIPADSPCLAAFFSFTLSAELERCLTCLWFGRFYP